MKVEKYLDRSRLYQRVKSAPHGELVERYATRLVEDGFSRVTIRKCLTLVKGLLGWIAQRRYNLTDIDERTIERYLRHRAQRQAIRPGNRIAFKRWLSVLRNEGVIAPAAPQPLTPHDQILKVYQDYLRAERGLAHGSIVTQLPTIRRFLHEVCPTGADDLGKISQESVIRYIERHARDWSPSAGKVMCSSLRSFLQYLHHRGFIERALAGCVPSIRRWKLTTLPTYLSAAEVQTALSTCNRKTATGRRDYAILMVLAKLGLRAGEVCALTLDDIDWRVGEMQICRKGGRPATMPIPRDVGAAITGYLRNGRPNSSCRRVFLRTRAPHHGIGVGAITIVARRALDRAGIRGCAHRGAHIFRHSLATLLLRSGATLTEIGHLLGHESHDTTRIYAKVDIKALRLLCLPWPGAT
jgi:site-specific recombinase XerD